MRLNHLFSSGSANAKLREKGHSQQRELYKSLKDRNSLQARVDLKTFFIVIFFSGVHGGADTHVPFPNTVVKGSSGDGTVHLTMGE